MHLNNLKILVIDQDPRVFDVFEKAREVESFQVYHASSFHEGLERYVSIKPHLVFAELLFDNNDGIELIELIRERLEYLAVFVIYTDVNDNYSQIAALNAGADDFVVKPLSSRLLLSKIKAYRRRLGTREANNVKEVRDVRIDGDRYLVYRKDRKIELQKKEFEIISLLSSQPEKVFSREEIKKRIWGEEQDVRNRTIDVHIRKLRSKMGEDLIHTVKGVGYRF